MTGGFIRADRENPFGVEDTTAADGMPSIEAPGIAACNSIKVAGRASRSLLSQPFADHVADGQLHEDGGTVLAAFHSPNTDNALNVSPQPDFSSTADAVTSSDAPTVAFATDLHSSNTGQSGVSATVGLQEQVVASDGTL